MHLHAGLCLSVHRTKSVSSLIDHRRDATLWSCVNTEDVTPTVRRIHDTESVDLARRLLLNM